MKDKSMFSIETFYQTYETETISIKIGNKPFSFLTPKNLEKLLDASDELNQFPLWVKIWESSLILIDYLVNQNRSSKRLLDLGAGLGAIGIIAEAYGYQVTATENDPHAQQFLTANAYINKSQGINIQKLNWLKPEITGKFDIIVGSELVYKESDFKALVAFFQKHLLPGGEILLANESRKLYEPFLKILKQSYHIEIWRKKLRAADETKTILLTRLTGKNTS
jgi:predicted nicotinamide N-methyase